MDENKTNPNLEPSSTDKPTDSTPEGVAPAPPKVSASSIYPEATKTIGTSSPTPAQQFALTESNMRIQKSNQPVWKRVKALLALAIVSALTAVLALVGIFSQSGAGGIDIISAVIVLLQLGTAVYLLAGKDHNTVGRSALGWIVYPIYVGAAAQK